MKKILSVFLSVLMLLSVMPMSIFAEESTATETVYINSVDDLETFAKAVAEGDTYTGKKVVLNNDIDFAGKEFAGVGVYGKPFSGEFDGNDKVIKNLTNETSADHKGLFAHINGAYIHDLTFTDVKFGGTVDGSLYAGALAGEGESYNYIYNVDVNGITYNTTAKNGSFAGLIGYSYDDRIENCDVTNAVFNVTSTSGVNVGGLVGQGRGVGNTTKFFAKAAHYVNCKVITPVFNVTGKTTVGGFIGCDGYNHWANWGSDCTVTDLTVNCAAGDAQYTVGGFMGSNNGANYGAEYAFENCKVDGNSSIKSESTNTASTFGGFVGYVGGRPLSIGKCTTNVTIDVTAGDVGGFAGETSQYFAHQYEFENCVANGDVSTNNGNAGSFIANIQHGGDGSALNVVINGCTANGTATAGTEEVGFVGNVNDTKKDNPTGGNVVVSDSYAGDKLVESVPQQNADSVNVAAGKLVAAIGGKAYETLSDAIAAATDGDTITVYDGTHTMPNSVANKNITIKGSENAVIEMYDAIGANGSTIAFEGITAKFDNDDYEGLQHSVKVTYTNCTIEGKQHLYAPTVVFTDCILNNKQDYSVWTYGATDVTFTGCTFNSGGKAILVYNEDTSGSFVANIKASNCIFNDDGTLDTKKAAIELGNNPAKTNTYNLNIEKCTVNGFAVNDEGTSTGSALWGNKNSMSVEKLEVIIDGVDVLDVPKGEVSRGMYSTSNNRIQGAVMNANPKESVVLELYSGETKIATTTLTNADYLVNAATELTWSFCITDTSSSWSTVWEEGHPVSDAKPDKVVLYIDGVNVAENTVTLHKDNFDMVGEEAVWSEIEGVTSKAEEPKAELIDNSYDLSLSEWIFINQYVGIDIEGYDQEYIEANGGLLMWNAPVDESNAVFGNQDEITEGLVYGGTYNDKPEYWAQTSGIAAKEYADEIYCRAYLKLKDGTYIYTDIIEHSVQKYCEYILSQTYEEGTYGYNLQKVCFNMLQYGASAQILFNYNTGDLANANFH